MLSRHLTTQEIQELAINRAKGDKELILHVDHCPICREEVAAYQALFASIKKEELPVLEFDLAEAVLSRIENPVPVKQNDTFLLTFVGVAVAVLVAGIIILFGEKIMSLFTGLFSYVVYLTLFSVFVLVFIVISDMYKGYRQKMKLLDFHL